jgi:hypothetical protein
MATKIETIYNKINKENQEIKIQQKYDNNSASFGHFFIKMMFDTDDQIARESITDGGNDNGIDAIYIDNRNETTIHFLQFKFPESVNTVSSGFTDAEIKGLGTGVQHFLTSGSLDPKKWNRFLLDKHDEIRLLDDYSTKLWIIRYTNAQITHQHDLLKKCSENIENLTLNKCYVDIYGAKEICDLFQNKYEKNYPTIKIKLEAGNQYQSYETDKYKSITTVCYIENLYDAVSDVRDRIFDGNVRFYNPKTDVTNAIRNTLENDPDNFILYNNGITILTERASYNSPNQTFTLKSASIINGAQTVGSILDVIDSLENKEFFKKAPIFLRILEIEENDKMINDIVYSLNTQTKMFSAYSISNDIRLRALQKEINDKTIYFLEVKYNEFETLKKTENLDKYKKNKLNAEQIIQVYVGYNDINNKAYLAKLAKSDLLKDDEMIDKILDGISLEKFKESYYPYIRITEIIGLFRSYRSSKNLNILEILSIDESEINHYQFLTTGDILTLFATRHCKIANPKLSDDEAIIKAIKTISKSLKNLSGKKKKALSNITKSKSTFDRIKKSVYRNVKG